MRLIFVLAIFSFAPSLAFAQQFGLEKPKQTAPPAELDKFIERYGKPDDSGSNEKQKPTRVTRWLVYKAEKVRVFFVAEGKGWKRTEAVVDDKTRMKLSDAAINVKFYDRDSEVKAWLADRGEAEKAIREAIALLKKRHDGLKNEAEKAKISAAITAMESAFMAKPIARPVVDPAKVTRENYGKIKINMSIEEVEEVLGQGKETSNALGVTNMRWQNENGTIVVSLTFDTQAGFVSRLLSKRISD
jgi:hypothetical protein